MFCKISNLAVSLVSLTNADPRYQTASFATRSLLRLPACLHRHRLLFTIANCPRASCSLRRTVTYPYTYVNYQLSYVYRAHDADDVASSPVKSLDST